MIIPNRARARSRGPADHSPNRSTRRRAGLCRPQSKRVATLGLTAALGVSLLGAPMAFADPTTPTTPGAAAATTGRDSGPDACAQYTPDPDTRIQAGALPTERQSRTELFKGSERLSPNPLISQAAKMIGIDESEFPTKNAFPEFRAFDDTLQGEGLYGAKTSLQSGLPCAIVDSLVETKVRRDVAQKVAMAFLSLPTLLAGIEGPDVASVITNGVGCGVAIAQAAAAGAMAGGTSGAAAAAAAPAAISAAPVCIAAAGDAAVIAGKLINIWEHNPAFPQLAEFSAILNPDSVIGKKVVSKLPKVLRENKEFLGMMKTLSRFILKLSEIWIGKSVAVFGDAVRKAAAGDVSATPKAAVGAVEIGLQLFMAAVYAFTGSDTLEFGGETLVDPKALTNMQTKIITGGITSLPGEGSELVDGGKLGGNSGISQPLRDLQTTANLGCLMGANGGASGLSTAFNTGYQTQDTKITQAQNRGDFPWLGGGQQNSSGNVNLPWLTQTPSAPTTTQAPQGVTGGLDWLTATPTTTQAPQAGGQQQYPAQTVAPGVGQQASAQGPVLMQQPQCAINGKSFTMDQTQMLSAADLNQLRQVPGAVTPADPKKRPDGALWGLDAQDPKSIAASLPLLGANGLQLPGLPGFGESINLGAANGSGSILSGLTNGLQLPTLPGLGQGGVGGAANGGGATSAPR